MVRRTVSSTIFILVLALLGGQPAQANTPLTRAVVSSLRNQVRLLPNREPVRKAKLSDVLKPGDGIVTSRRSLAELRFNDGSLARMGEQAVFRFIPKTRSFRLSNGTVLMLIPPGQGRTQVRTPNVTAGIRGSALMIRYDKATDTSTVIALTNSQISVTNRDGEQSQVLVAGQAVVTIGDEIVDSYDVDLQELYRTSPLLRDLELNNPDAEVQDEAVAQVREETLEGIQSQRDFVLGEGRDRTEDFRLSANDMEEIIADEGFGAVANSDAVSFPGQAIGVDSRFNDDEGGQLTASPANEPSIVVEPPATAITEVIQPIEELPQVVDELPLETPTIVEVPEIELPIAVDDIPAVLEIPVEDTISDSPVDDLPGGDDDIAGGDDLIGGGDVAGGDDLIGGDDIAGGDDLIGGDDIAGGDDLIGGDDIAGGDDLIGGDDIAGGDDLIGGDDVAGDDDLIGGDDVAAGGDDLFGGDDIAGGDDLVGGDDIADDVTAPDNSPIAEVDLPTEIPGFGDGTGALNPAEETPDVENDPSNDVDVDITVNITVTVDGVPADTTVEPGPDDNVVGGGS